VQAYGDGEAHLSFPAGLHHLLVVEARVGPQGEGPGGFGPPDPLHRLRDETGCPAGGMGRASAQAGMEYFPAPRGHGEQGMVAAYVGVGESVPPGLLQAVGLADGGVDVYGERRVSRSGAGRPGAGEESAGDRIELQGVPPGKGA
jgi:hypothetical protein